MQHDPQPLRVTLDTNVLNRILEPEKYRNHVQYQAFWPIRRAIELGRIAAYYGDASLFFEGWEKKDRVKAFSSPRVVPGPVQQPQTHEDGSISITRHVTIEHDFPPLNAWWQAKKVMAAELGIRLLRCGRMYDRGEVTDGMAYAEDRDLESARRRQAILAEVLRAIESRPTLSDAPQNRVGMAKLKAVAAKYHDRGRPRGVPPDLWPRRPWYKDVAHVRKGKEATEVDEAIAELADADCIAGHISYGFDYLCSMDRGKSVKNLDGQGRRVKGKSIFDVEHRQWLAQAYQLRIVEPVELVALLG